MAASTSSTLADITKEVWTASRLEKQFYPENDFFSKIERTDRWTVGKKAVVPIHKGRGGGDTSWPSGTVTALNPASYQKVDRAEYTIPQHGRQIEIDLSAMNEASGGDTSAVESVVLEVEGAVDDFKHALERQFLGNGDALIAQCTTNTNSTTILLLATGYGYDAIVRGWLHAGQTVDIGTTGSEASVVADTLIASVVDSSSAPAIVIGSAMTTSSSHYVSIANARSGSTSYEASGLRTIFGSATSTVGTLASGNSGEEFWKPAKVGTETTLSLDGILDLQLQTQMRAKSPASTLILSLKQRKALYELLQSQVRFANDSVTAGGVKSTSWSDMDIFAVPAIPDREIYLLNTADLAIVTGKKVTGPRWASDIGSSGNAGMLWRQGYSSFVDGLFYPAQLAAKRRNGGASNISLTD